jgi:hypothetical protein
VRIRVTDQWALWREEAFTISIRDAAENRAPSDISRSNSSVAENQPAGTSVGNFSATDPDSGQTHSYSLVPGTGSADNSSFQIVGAELRTAAVFDYETKNLYTIRVRSTDNGTPAASIEEAFTITVTDVNETHPPPPAAANSPPKAIGLSNSSVAGKAHRRVREWRATFPRSAFTSLA